MWVIKLNKKPEITFACCTFCICNIISIREPLDIYFWSPFNVPCKSNRSFLCKFPRLSFSFLSPGSFEFILVFLVAFSSFLSFTDRNAWTLDGRIYYLVEGSTKPQIFRNPVKVACLSYGKNCGMNSFSGFAFSLLLFSKETIVVNNFSQLNIWFCFM